MNLPPYFKLILCLVFFTLSGCSNSLYGVNEKHWNTLSEVQRTEVIKGYNEREKIRAETYRAQQKIRAENAKAARIKTAWDVEQKQRRVDDIYAGNTTRASDLIAVYIEHGTIAFRRNKQDTYHPVHFDIAEGEEKQVVFQQKNGHKNQKITVRYEDSVLIFDVDNRPKRRSNSLFLHYNPSWRRGKTYKNIHLNKHTHSDAKNITISVETLGE